MKKISYKKPAIRKDKIGVKFFSRKNFGSQLDKQSVFLAAIIGC